MMKGRASSRNNDPKFPSTKSLAEAAPDAHKRVVLQNTIIFKVDALQNQEGAQIRGREKKFSPKVRTGCITCR